MTIELNQRVSIEVGMTIAIKHPNLVIETSFTDAKYPIYQFTYTGTQWLVRQTTIRFTQQDNKTWENTSERPPQELQFGDWKRTKDLLASIGDSLQPQRTVRAIGFEVIPNHQKISPNEALTLLNQFVAIHAQATKDGMHKTAYEAMQELLDDKLDGNCAFKFN